MPDTFRFLHISDLHIALDWLVVGFPDVLKPPWPPGHRPGLISSYDPNLAIAVARFAYEQQNQFDIILLSGDLATTGTPEDLTEALQFVDSLPAAAFLNQVGTPTLRGASSPIVILPGNHDRFDGPLCNPGGTEFFAAFNSYWPAAGRAQLLAVLQGPAGERLAIIGADFTLRTSRDADSLLGVPFPGYLGQGKVYDDVLNELEHITDDTRRSFDPVAIVWAVHFPIEFSNLSWTLRFIDDFRLAQLAHNTKVQHIYSGHTHEPRIYQLTQYNVTIHCAGSATQYQIQEGNFFHLRQIQVHRGSVVDVASVDYRWDDTLLCFNRI